ncbi:4Fe-4S dicluster domain-containing protein [Nannocystaceae bacterium ST9]
MTKPNATHPTRKTRLPVLGSAGASNDQIPQEFAPGADELVIEGGASRRKFIGLIGASTALAGLGSTGCLRKPVENIMPFAKRPEDLIPGVPVYYATAMQVGGTVQGLLVESHDGRPTKIEGNPRHSGSQGATDVFAQGTLLSLYDPERSRQPKSSTVSAHTYAPAGQLEEAKKATIEHLCTILHDRSIAATNSIDAAEQAKVRCEQAIESSGVWETGKADDGREIAAVSIDWDEQIETTWDDAWGHLLPKLRPLHAAGGQGLALVVAGSLSPSYRALQQRFVAAYPQAKVVLCDPTFPINTIRASEMVAGEGARAYYSLERVKTIVAVDCDFLGLDTDHIRLAREFSEGRKLMTPEGGDALNRLYVVEPHLTSTGAAADERLRLPATDIVDFLAALVIELIENHGARLPSGSEGFASVIQTRGQFDDRSKRFIAALASDLAASALPDEEPVEGEKSKRERVVVMVGERQPPLAQGLGFLINNMLLASTVKPPGSLRFSHRLDTVPYAGLVELARGLDDGSITHVICLGTNPAYEGPGVLALAEKLQKATLLVHAGTHCDETGQLAHWHLPLSHFLEAWGDLEALDGTTSIVQPLIAPLFDTRSEAEILAMLLPRREGAEWVFSAAEQPGATLVKDFWKNEIKVATRSTQSLSDRVWRRWLHDGLVSGIPRSPTALVPNNWQPFADMMVGRKVDEDAPYEIDFHLDPKVLAGAYSNNAWMQELPHPLTKLVWDNGAYISATLAAELGIVNGQNLSIKVGEARMEVPVWIAPGQHDKTVSLTLGYGRVGVGSVAAGAGFDVNKLRPDETTWFARGEISRGSGKYDLVSTQDYGSLDPDDLGLDDPDGSPFGLNFEKRPIYRETTVAGFKKDPDFAKRGDLMPPERLKSPWSRHDSAVDPNFGVPIMHGPHHWGMAIDLNLCVSCNACVIACQAENNIAIVGKKQCANGREMHWIRIDRYYTGSEDNPDAVVMPVGCQHCETAPCENVCPVQATAHSPEGLNDMAYNRCIGTRYCANNCPYKVRRFNFFNFNEDLDPVVQLVKNPDVTVRFRGVIEKCSYCVQRINTAKIEAHLDGRDKVRDGEVISACQQVCPTRAIAFGDISDPESAVSKAKYADDKINYQERQPAKRSYGLLTDLNTQPRTTYLGRVRNPNPKLA